MSVPVSLETDGKVAIITLNRPEVMNAINETMLPPWVAALEECRSNPEIGAIVITGAGEAFCRGGDTSKLGEHTAPDPVDIKEQFWDRLHSIPRKLAEIDKPVIAAVNGLASGAGVDVALQCDIRFAAQSAEFRVSYTAFGLVPGNGGTYFLPRIVGEAKALELFFAAQPISADEALRVGMINQVFDDGEFIDRSLAFAHDITERAPLAMKLVKRAVRQSLSMDLNTHLDMVSSHMLITRPSEDHAEAIKAYEEGRQPKFKGR
ncbi:MAG: enoyl-CoA hydratase/isomerase family protein [Halioglobus sp.]|nr:enoyl-CoA hydratase/isomerase family protein [Halioglobus sp.]